MSAGRPGRRWRGRMVLLGFPSAEGRSRSHRRRRSSTAVCRLAATTVVVAFVHVVPALGGTVRIDLPEPVGSYQFDEPSSFGPEARVLLETPFSSSAVTSARMILRGTAAPGVVRGDGVTREATDAPLEGGAAVTFSAVEMAQIGLPVPTNGQFHLEKEYQGPFCRVIPLPGPSQPPATLDALVVVRLGPILSRDNPPWLVDLPASDGPYPVPSLWSEGLEVITTKKGTGVFSAQGPVDTGPGKKRLPSPFSAHASLGKPRLHTAGRVGLGSDVLGQRADGGV